MFLDAVTAITGPRPPTTEEHRLQRAGDLGSRPAPSPGRPPSPRSSAHRAQQPDVANTVHGDPHVTYLATRVSQRADRPAPSATDTATNTFSSAGPLALPCSGAAPSGTVYLELRKIASRPRSRLRRPPAGARPGCQLHACARRPVHRLGRPPSPSTACCSSRPCSASRCCCRCSSDSPPRACSTPDLQSSCPLCRRHRVAAAGLPLPARVASSPRIIRPTGAGHCPSPRLVVAPSRTSACGRRRSRRDHVYIPQGGVQPTGAPLPARPARPRR